MDSIHERYFHKTGNRHNIIVPPVVTQISHIANIEEVAQDLRKAITNN